MIQLNKIGVTNQEISRSGAVSKLFHAQADIRPTSFNVRLNRLAQGTGQYFFIGDPSGLIRVLAGYDAGYGTPSSGSTPGAILNTTFGAGPIAIKGVNYKVLTSGNQFQNGIYYASGDIDGSFQKRLINTAIACRNSQANPKLLTLEFTQQPLILNAFSALQIYVNAGEVVDLVFTVDAMAGR